MVHSLQPTIQKLLYLEQKFVYLLTNMTRTKFLLISENQLILLSYHSEKLNDIVSIKAKVQELILIDRSSYYLFL